MKKFILAAALFVATPLTALADPYVDMGLTEVKRIQDYKINSWNHVDDYSLMIDGSPSTKYLITFKNRCRDLRFANAIAAPTKGGAIQAGFDSIRVVGKDNHPMPCMIKSIYEVKGDRAAVSAVRDQVRELHKEQRKKR